MEPKHRLSRTAAIVFSVLSGASLLAAGFAYLAFVGLPLSAAQRHDRVLVGAVQEARDWVASYYMPFSPTPNNEHAFPQALVDAARAAGHWGNRLPPSLVEAARIVGVNRAEALGFLVDPATHETITYHPGPGSSYRLCVTFASSESYEGAASRWNHAAGAHCYTFDAKDGAGAPLPKRTNAWFQFC